MRKLPAETVYYVRTAVWEFNSGLIFTSIWVLYYSVMKLSFFEISLIFIVIAVSNLILEVPTGIVADVYSRRLSVILGGVFIGLAYVLMGAFPIFVVALIAGFVEAIGDTFVSGALQAWITDEVGTERVGKVFLRGRQIAIPAHWVGVGLSIALAAWFNYQTPIVLGGAMWFALTLFLILFMPETHFVRANADTTDVRPLASLHNHARAALATLADGARLVRGSRLLLLLFIAQFFAGAFFDSFYKFSRAHILQSFTLPVFVVPVLGALKDNAWFGILEALQGLIVLFGAEGVRRYVNLANALSVSRVVVTFYALMFVGLLVFAFTGNLLLALAAWLVVNGFQDLGAPITETWLNQNIPSHVRATVLSMNNQIGVLGMMGGSSALSIFGDRFGVRSALALSSVLLLPLLALYGRGSQVLADSVRLPTQVSR